MFIPISKSCCFSIIGRHQEATSAGSRAWGYDNAPSRDYAGHYQTTVPPSPPPAGIFLTLIYRFNLTVFANSCISF